MLFLYGKCMVFLLGKLWVYFIWFQFIVCVERLDAWGRHEFLNKAFYRATTHISTLEPEQTVDTVVLARMYTHHVRMYVLACMHVCSNASLIHNSHIKLYNFSTVTLFFHFLTQNTPQIISPLNLFPKLIFFSKLKFLFFLFFNF